MTQRSADTVAARLLEAQVDYVLAELGPARFADAAAAVVADAFEIAGTLTIGDVVDPGEVTNSLLVLADQLGDNAVVRNLAVEFAEAIHDLPAASQYKLSDLIGRELVSRLVTKALSMRELQDRALTRLTDSPVVSGVAASFVNKIVDSFAAGNRAKAEKIPGLGSVFAMGDLLTDAVRGSAVGKVIDEATAGVTQFAVQNATGAVREILDNAPLHDAAMELWDLRADEPLSEGREYLDKGDVRDFVNTGLDAVAGARNSGYTGEVIAELVRVFFANYGRHTVAALLTELGFDPEELSNEIITHVPPVIDAASRDGLLSAKIRTLLEPFYTSDVVREILADDEKRV